MRMSNVFMSDQNGKTGKE